MKALVLAITASLFLSGCSSGHFRTSDVSHELNTNSIINHEGIGTIESSFGSHDIYVEVDDYNITEMMEGNNLIKIMASGKIFIEGPPYQSSPSFNAVLSGSTKWTEDNKLKLKISSASKIKLHDISKLHLNSIRNEVKDIIAMTLVEHDDIVLDNIKTKDGLNAKFWDL